ncbi:hypothetical protein LOK49_LG08G01618 [Camellia lanceoleosa]|uniref:Uncharacterized protein n=1 Tax=Camellia lanceoleosa TaxID=1840588 RepID=A0ACC0GVQ2_9ERIC|nr:hypothetical protein LOK49_LG08G01618 [Camellia lanceoleosa]
MAPEEALPEILQAFILGRKNISIWTIVILYVLFTHIYVPLGCVTPFALVHDSARYVSKLLHVLLMDKGFKDQECCFFHPLLNDTSISLRVHNLDKFLKSIGKDPTYASPSVWKDQPPDLAAFVPSDAIVLQEDPEKAAPPQVPEKKNCCCE